MTLSVWRLALLVQQVDRSGAVLALRVIEFRGYPLLVGLRRKGRGGEAMGEKGRRVGIELQRSERLLCFSRKFTVLDLVKLKASLRISERLYTFLKTRLGPECYRSRR